MANTEKVSELYKTAGAALVKLGELTSQLIPSDNGLNNAGKWSEKELEFFRLALTRFCNDLNRLSSIIKSRTTTQIENQIKKKLYEDCGLPVPKAKELPSEDCGLPVPKAKELPSEDCGLPVPKTKELPIEHLYVTNSLDGQCEGNDQCFPDFFEKEEVSSFCQSENKENLNEFKSHEICTTNEILTIELLANEDIIMEHMIEINTTQPSMIERTTVVEKKAIEEFINTNKTMEYNSSVNEDSKDLLYNSKNTTSICFLNKEDSERCEDRSKSSSREKKRNELRPADESTSFGHTSTKRRKSRYR